MSKLIDLGSVVRETKQVTCSAILLDGAPCDVALLQYSDDPTGLPAY